MRARQAVGLTFLADGEIKEGPRGPVPGALIAVCPIRPVADRALQISAEACGRFSFGLLSCLIVPLVGEAESPGEQTFGIKSAGMASRL